MCAGKVVAPIEVLEVMALGGSSDALMLESRGGREEHMHPSPVLRTHRHDGGALECLCRAVAARRSPNRCT